jgi:peptidoglycan/LPS O-acetylase OafA/YrhL
MTTQTPPLGPLDDGRRTDLDWIRIGAFALLILYHVGMFYVPSDWDWHVKSRWSSER